VFPTTEQQKREAIAQPEIEQPLIYSEYRVARILAKFEEYNSEFVSVFMVFWLNSDRLGSIGVGMWVYLFITLLTTLYLPCEGLRYYFSTTATTNYANDNGGTEFAACAAHQSICTKSFAAFGLLVYLTSTIVKGSVAVIRDAFYLRWWSSDCQPSPIVNRLSNIWYYLVVAIISVIGVLILCLTYVLLLTSPDVVQMLMNAVAVNFLVTVHREILNLPMYMGDARAIIAIRYARVRCADILEAFNSTEKTVGGAKWRMLQFYGTGSVSAKRKVCPEEFHILAESMIWWCFGMLISTMGFYCVQV
jgi:hypothetical protein